MIVARIVLVQVAGLALTTLTIIRSGERPHVLVYAAIVEVLMRLVYARAAGQRWQSLTDDRGHPVPFRTHVVVIAFLATLAFVLVNVNARKELDLDLATLGHDVRWALGPALIYLVQGAVTKTLAMDPRDVTILAFAVLSAGAIVAGRQMMGLTSSGWVVLGPLLVFRFLFDLNAARQSARQV
jgi:hypothetical protein